MTSPNRNDEKCTRLTRNGPSFRKVAERVQQWNRAIPESNYITLGTIRYGVRHSPGPLSLGLSAAAQPPAAATSTSTSRTDLVGNDRSPSSEQRGEFPQAISAAATHSTALDTCCCLRPTSALNFPWVAAGTQNSSASSRTKLPVPTSGGNCGAAKNRTQLSTAKQASSNSLSFSSMSLAVSSAPTPAHTSRSQSLLLSSEISSIEKDDDHVVDRQIDDRTQTDESCGLESIEEAATLGERTTMPKIATTTTLPQTRISTTPSVISNTEGISGDRPMYGKRSGCVCCQNAARNSSDTTNGSSSNISGTSANSTARNISGEIGCCCELNSGSAKSVAVGQFCELSTPLPQATSKSLSGSPSPSSLSSSSTVCCYTIANSGKSISKHGNRGSHQGVLQKRLPRVISQQDIGEKIVQVPPVPPPRPRPHNSRSTSKDRGQGSDKNSASANLNSVGQGRPLQNKDPINFRRKVQQFESYRKNGDRKSDDSGNVVGCGSDHVVNAGFELLSCFSGGSLNADNSTRNANCCSPNNSEISYSGSSSKSEPHLTTNRFKQLPSTGNNTNNTPLSGSDNLQDRPPISVSRNNSHPTLRKVIVPNLQKPLSDLDSFGPKAENNSQFYRKLTPHLTKKSFLPHRRDVGGKTSDFRQTKDEPPILPQRVVREERDEDCVLATAEEDRSLTGNPSDEAISSSSRSGASESHVINNVHNDNDRVRATLVEIVNDDADDDDDDDDIIESVDNDDEFIDYDDDVDSEICFIDSSQSDIDLIGSLNGHYLNLSGNIHSNLQRGILSEPSLSGTSAPQQYTRPIQLSSFNTNSLFLSDDQVPNSRLGNNSNYRSNSINNSSNQSSGKLLVNNSKDHSKFNANSSSYRNKGDIDFIVRKLPGSENGVSVHETYKISSSYSVAEIDESNRNLSSSNLSLQINSDFNKGNAGSEPNETNEVSRIIPRIDRSQSFDSYKKSVLLPLSSPVSVAQIVSSSSGQLASSAASLTPTSPLSFSYTAGITSPTSSSPSLLVWIPQQFPLGGGQNSKGPYIIGRRVSSSDSFGNFTKNQLHANTTISPESGVSF
ncbi:unnamed protein product [Hermetia illucens]|uniref:Uncharacterized protein n=1 Tax=Hermetia illucens TaxID=343691 RepID=A0A7R8V6Y8_HERIL|nr:unnamed protein product [Hermetia illucens]